MDIYQKIYNGLRDNRNEADTFPITVNVTPDEVMLTMEAIGSREEKLYGQMNRQLKESLSMQVMPLIQASIGIITAYQSAVQAHAEMDAASEEPIPPLTATPPTALHLAYAQLAQSLQAWESTIDGNMVQEISISKARF